MLSQRTYKYILSKYIIAFGENLKRIGTAALAER